MKNCLQPGTLVFRDNYYCFFPIINTSQEKAIAEIGNVLGGCFISQTEQKPFPNHVYKEALKTITIKKRKIYFYVTVDKSMALSQPEVDLLE